MFPASPFSARTPGLNETLTPLVGVDVETGELSEEWAARVEESQMLADLAQAEMEN
jgi:hypothetical protein